MRNIRSSFTVLVLLGACGGKSTPTQTAASSPAPQATLVGTFHRADERATAMRFAADGTCAVAQSAAELSAATTLCTWKLDGSRLTFTNSQGSCAETDATRVGVYDIVVAAHGVTFKMVNDTCERRMSIDGETWERLPD
jgi:hypothetical protein